MKTYKKIITMAVVLLMTAATLINVVILFGVMSQFACHILHVNNLHQLSLSENIAYFIVSSSGLLTTFLYFKKLYK